ncbi:MAG: PDZ domain-containing protein [Deltaproteobacteria bacterium]|nr:PDZ domain-containing protein [Deltaproteobacteria bacterium]
MRHAAALVLAFATACGAKVVPAAVGYDEDLGGRTRSADDDGAQPARDGEAPRIAERPRAEAPPGKGLRHGTIERARLVAILDAGPAMFLRQFEMIARLESERFIGWQLVQLVDRASPLADVDLVPGDVLLAVNGKPLSRPDQLQSVWDSLRTANEVTAQLWRGEMKLTLAFAIEPKL